MIIVRLKGGLGNQMFQYALGKNLAIKNNTKLILDTDHIKFSKFPRKYELDKFNISGQKMPLIIRPLFLCLTFLQKILKLIKLEKKFMNYFSNLIRKISGNKYFYIFEDNAFYFNKKILQKKGKVILLEGYWSREEYFEEIRKILKKEFVLREKLDKKNNLLLNKIKNSNSVCIHIRRGDYVKSNVQCLLKYYQDSIKIIKGKVKYPKFFVFSDDLKWVKENLTNKGVIYVSINKPNEGYKDLNLMRNCKHFIISNSSFSWWAAWLSENKNKLVCIPEEKYKSKYEINIIQKT